MNNAKLQLEVVSPTSIRCGHIEWFALDTKLVGKVKVLLEENKELEQQDEKTLQTLVKIRDEIDWIISTTNDELALARCKLILQYLNEVI